MDKKTCFKCGETKGLDEFYKHSMMSDGHVNKCKECNKKDVRKNRKDKLEYYRGYDRARGPRRTLEDLQRYRKENPEKYSAHILINNAVTRGKLFKPDRCEVCGKTDTIISGHHDDYSKPLEVKWVCAACHCAIHNNRSKEDN